MSRTHTLNSKLKKLSRSLREKIVTGERRYKPSSKTPVSNHVIGRKLHCNGGQTSNAGEWLRDHCRNGGKIFLTMAGAGSSFQLGITISELIRAGHIAGISVTGANMEESMYRLVAHSHYAYIPQYESLTRDEEDELDRIGFRRITDTFLPEEESVRVILPELEQLWRKADEERRSQLWHQYFFDLFDQNLIVFDPKAKKADCWLHQAWEHDVEVFVPGYEDSTMGNIFSYYTYDGNHKFLRRYKQKKPISRDVVLPGVSYMHRLAEWYMDTAPATPLAFVQLGGGIAGDFPICVVPHLQKDYLADLPIARQRRLIPRWAGFAEIHSSPMSFGSYSGAGFKEKITWSKLAKNAYGIQIFGDFTQIFPDIAAIVLGK